MKKEYKFEFSFVTKTKQKHYFSKKKKNVALRQILQPTQLLFVIHCNIGFWINLEGECLKGDMREISEKSIFVRANIIFQSTEIEKKEM